MTAENSLVKLYTDTFGSAPASITPLAGAGSNRRYFRLQRANSAAEATPESVIGTIGEDVTENTAFIKLSAALAGAGLPVPRVLAVGENAACYLQNDLGDVSMFDILSRTRTSDGFTPDTCRLLEECIRMLPHIQFTGGEAVDFNCCFPESSLTSAQILRDLNYFKYNFLKLAGIELDEPALDRDFERLHAVILSRTENCRTFMVRDFQSRNVMIQDNRPYLIDFQGGRRGPVEYDVASFLWQARAGIPDELRSRLIAAYIDEASAVSKTFNPAEFSQSLPYFVLFRSLQTLGAYGFRGLTERKPHFLRSIPAAINSTGSQLENNGFQSTFPAICDAIGKVKQTAWLRDLKTLIDIPPFDGLTITVASFSYKKGIPIDLSGNGGGFAFDCRAIHNPGRYEPYKQLTGRDAPVKEFLERNGEIFEFLSHVYALTDASISRYLKRGFSSLCVNFGCTGGQHRSVYSAEATARHIAATFHAVRVVLCHKEQQIIEVIPPAK